MKMRFSNLVTGALTAILGAYGSSPGRAQPAAAQNASLEAFQSAAARYHSIITVPTFETTTNELETSVKETVARAQTALDQVGRLQPAQVTFANTVRALDDVGYIIGSTENRLTVIKETSQDPAVRDAATDQLKILEAWAVGLDYRMDVYRAVKAYSDTRPSLEGEDAKLLKDTMRDYLRAGLALPQAQRDEVEALRKKLSGLEEDFKSNVTKAERRLVFTRAEMEGVPEDFLDQKGVKNDDGTYAVMANITWHYLTVMENARNEQTRLKMETARDQLARDENVPLLQQLLVIRDTIAKKLGYKSWADYVIEIKMAKTAAQATDFLERLKVGLQPKFDSEIAEFRALKIKETGDANAQIYLWDWRYFANELKKEKYTIDEDALKVYFPYQRCLEGMFAIYQRIFGLKFQRITPPYKWVDDLQLYAVSDSATGEPMGLFYLDMFPREGKYNHFAEFGIIDGKLLDDGQYQRPTVALICNFPSPQPGVPSLLDHEDVVTLFHEFGHAMHAILTRAKYSRFSGTSVPGDFVEAPSQMLENWAWDKKVLDSFAADYRDPSKKIPEEILNQLKASKLAVEASFYRRQLGFGLTDLALHTQIHAGNVQETVPLSNRIVAETFFPEPPDTAWVAYFGHIMDGYDAGYYGYAWADAIAADMATVFENAPDGYFDVEAGARLRREIYEKGNSRDVEISIEKFLGRKQSVEPFLKKIGMAAPGK
ncbi:MAG TPA: M3 family metallopeptidase [Candidatus Baltobacteraceae bacterium]|jgi:thimet oligopeptidase|nr:M3 family metallopeptidase [Candidatus Baltobacteraceae bacterium]